MADRTIFRLAGGETAGPAAAVGDPGDPGGGNHLSHRAAMARSHRRPDRRRPSGLLPGHFHARPWLCLLRSRGHCAAVLDRTGHLPAWPRYAKWIANRRHPLRGGAGTGVPLQTYPALIVTGLAAVAWLLPETPWPGAMKAAFPAAKLASSCYRRPPWSCHGC